MKKGIVTIGLTCMAAMALTGCGLFEKANGIILYGDQEKVEEALKEEHKGQVEKDLFSVKVIEEDDTTTLVLTNETVQFLVDNELLSKVINDKKAEAISSLEEVEAGEGLLFAKSQTAAEEFGSLDLDVNYGENHVIGDGRAYADMFLVVADEDFKDLAGADKMMGLIEYNKDPDGIGSFGVDKEQLVRFGN